MSDARSDAQPALLFTAFEPSGDAHAAPVIRRLLERQPNLKIYAWGGPKMEEAGATLVETTAADGAMGLNALGKAWAVKREVRRIKRWAKTYRVLAHVAVDSPAANFPICKTMRGAGARVIHLVAPQIWAWGGWRLRKLRKCTDLVLCLLPFEEQWFRDRKVPARFVGHPRMNRPVNVEELRERMHGLPQGTPRIALFPGSRSHEVKANIRLLVRAFEEIHSRHSGAGGVIAAANPELAALVRRKIKVFPTGLHMTVGLLDPVIAWAELCLTVSGTVTLDIARQQTPMIGVYQTGVISWLLSKVLLRAPLRLLPNIVADKEICPEFVPHIGGPSTIVKHAYHFLHDSKNAAIQQTELARVCQRFVGKKPAEESARLILKVVKDGGVD